MCSLSLQNSFALRLSKLRLNKGVSAREMSLSLGQNAAYINNIENGKSLPSMTHFFSICEYLEVSPKEFFELENENPQQHRVLMEYLKSLSPEQYQLLLNIISLISNDKKPTE